MRHVITNPRPLPRLGRTSFVVLSDKDGTSMDLSNTVLHELSTGQRASVEINGTLVPIPKVGQLRSRMFYTSQGEPVGRICNLPTDLLVIDVAIASGGRVGDAYRRAFFSHIQMAIRDRLLHFKQPGIMRHAIGDDGQLAPDEVGISSSDALRLFLSEIKRDSEVGRAYRDRLISAAPTRQHKVLAEFLAAEFSDPETTLRSVPKHYAQFVDGTRVFLIRFPNASSTSCRMCTLRVYRNAPGKALYIDPRNMVDLHQGDFDGDCLFAVPLEVPGDTRYRMLKWSPSLRRFRSSEAVEDMMATAPKPHDEYQALTDASVRGKYIGMLCYMLWQVGYTASYHYEELGYPSRASVWPDVLDLVTPLIEGVMDARKSSGASAEALAKLFIDTLNGVQSPTTLVEMLPKGENSTKALNNEQVELFSKILKIVTGGLPKAPIANPFTGSMMDEVVSKFIVRPGGLIRFLQELDEASPASVLVKSLFCEGFRPFKKGGAQ